MSDQKHIVIVGAGPAGVRAAETLVAAGLRPVVIDEAARAGGQIYRQPPADAGFARAKSALYGMEARKADAVHSTMANLMSKLDYRPDTLVWGCGAGQLDTFHAGRQRTVPYSHLLIATGATDRILPFPGWTLPGVYTLGASQIALKAQGCSIGWRVVFAGTGPLLYLVAYQYAKAGAQVEAILDTNPFSKQFAATPRLLKQPSTFAKGLYYVGWLAAHGVRIERGVRIVRADGHGAVQGITFSDGAREMTIPCDAIGFGYGLRSETQLADLAGCRFSFDALNRAWLPERDTAGRSSVAGVYLAGDGAGIAGADAAELAGRRAALAMLEDLKHPAADIGEASKLDRQLSTIARFRVGLEQAFAPPSDCASAWPDDMTVCRCEEVTAGTLRRCIRDGEASEINRLKALTRVGMGRCQGRMCGAAAAELLSAETGKSMADVGRLRGQAPIKPVPLSIALTADMNGADDLSPIPEHARDE
ncbi:NAD(P)/FAD-dependent oxidoreductase [Caballeronia sordidicola]|jgi:NADPH-dependent 2,4-dienoyl-CoA reductase/sulfur reductase-like enzyme|uniref:Opine oxidase subunit A n=1 Tax=Caballeronia sordidicola TaxID=196367 RepID=A0A242N0K8_CABSO|nr:FAD/NAD(P)-binding oxidoreductase [Caballeronia sordidicola]OTP76676.1 Opine oxidase subunit A [Caballeronia sordidicola]